MKLKSNLSLQIVKKLVLNRYYGSPINNFGRISYYGDVKLLCNTKV